MKLSVTAIILTKDEEHTLTACLTSVSFCDEIIVVDDFSTDKTESIVKRFQASLIKRHLNNNFASQRNFGLSQAKNAWVLYVDADEVISHALQEEIRQAITEDRFVGYFLKRQDIFLGKQLHYGETANVTLVRLGRKEKGEWIGRVHETWKIKGRIGKLNNPLLHFPHESISQFLHKINFYTELRAADLFEKKVSVSAFHILLYPKAKFFVNYVIKLGFLDGVPGIIMALMMCFHSFLVRAKLFLLYQQNEEKNR